MDQPPVRSSDLQTAARFAAVLVNQSVGGRLVTRQIERDAFLTALADAGLGGGWYSVANSSELTPTPTAEALAYPNGTEVRAYGGTKGIYRKNGAPGTGSYTKISDLPSYENVADIQALVEDLLDWAPVPLTNVGGDDQLVTATADGVTSPNQLNKLYQVTFPVELGLEPQIQINAATAVDLRDRNGDRLLLPHLVLAGSTHIIMGNGSNHRILTLQLPDTSVPRNLGVAPRTEGMVAGKTTDFYDVTLTDNPDSVTSEDREWRFRAETANVYGRPYLRVTKANGDVAQGEIRTISGEALKAGRITDDMLVKVTGTGNNFRMTTLADVASLTLDDDDVADLAAKLLGSDLLVAKPDFTAVTQNWQTSFATFGEAATRVMAATTAALGPLAPGLPGEYMWATDQILGTTETAAGFSLEANGAVVTSLLPPTWQVTDPKMGPSVQVKGARVAADAKTSQIVADPRCVIFEPGQRYRLTWRVRRVKNSTNPSNDPVVFGLQRMKADGTALAGAGGGRLDVLTQSISIGDGGAKDYVEITRMAAFEAADGVDIVLPAEARRGRVFVEIFGVTPDTNVGMLDVVDVTDTLSEYVETAIAAADAALGERQAADAAAASAATYRDQTQQVAAGQTARFDTLAQANASTTATRADVTADGANNGAYSRPNTAAAFVRFSTATLPALDARMAKRALLSDLPGRPSFSVGVDLEAVDKNGVRQWAIAEGEPFFPGAPRLHAQLGFYRADVNGAVIEAITQDGSLIVGPMSFSASLHATMKWGEVDAGGSTLRAVNEDGSLEVGPLKFSVALDARAGGGLWTAGGAPLVARDAFGVDIEAADFSAWVDGGQVFMDLRGAVVQITGGTGFTWKFAEVRGGLFRALRSDNKMVRSPLSGRYPELIGVDTVYGSRMYGQSGAAANAAGGVLASAPFSDRFLMFAAGQRAYGCALGNSQERTRPQQPIYDAIHDVALGFEQMVDAAGETSNSGYAFGLLRDAAFPTTAAIMTSCPAVGSADISMLAKNGATTDVMNTAGDPWRNLEDQFIREVLFWRFAGLKYEALSLRWNQGEGNVGATKATYQGLLAAIRTDWQALVTSMGAARTSGTHAGKSPLIVTQMVTAAKYAVPKSQVPWAQLQLGLDDPSIAICAGPIYDQAFAPDGVHPLALGQEMMGARAAIAELEHFKGNLYRPLCVRKDGANAPSRSGTTVTLKLWNHFNLPLVFDTTTITGLGADQGFQWFDNGDGNAVTVTAAAIVDTTTVTLTLSAVPTGTGGAIDVAMTGASGANSGPSTGNRSTLRTDGSGVLTRSGRPVEHFVCIDRVAVV